MTPTSKSDENEVEILEDNDMKVMSTTDTSDYFHHIGEIIVMADDTLLSLHESAHLLLINYVSNNSNNNEEQVEIPIDNILLRLFCDDNLPGQSFWIHDSTVSPVATDISTIGKKSSNGSVHSKQNYLDSLRKYGILRSPGNNNTIKLVIEVLENHQSQVRPANGIFSTVDLLTILNKGSVKVWVRILINPGAPEVVHECLYVYIFILLGRSNI